MEQQPSSSQTHSGLEPTRADFDAVVAERDALKDEVATLSSQLATVLARVSELEALRKTNSNNSSKPPSSDPPFQGPFRSNKPTGKKPGRQDGHEGVTNTPFAADAVTPEPLVPASCGHCGNDFAPDSPETSPPLVFQHIELPATPPPVIEYRRHERCCASCGRVTRASLPGDVGPSPYGARLQAMIVTWTFQFHLSRLKIQSLLASQYGLTISIGTIQKIIERVAAACEKPVEDLKAAINNAPVVNADETGHKHQGGGAKGKRHWLWVAVTLWGAIYAAAADRGLDGLALVLGADYKGTVGCDRWKPYESRFGTARQLCWAHYLGQIVIWSGDLDGAFCRRPWGGLLCIMHEALAAIVSLSRYEHAHMGFAAGRTHLRFVARERAWRRLSTKVRPMGSALCASTGRHQRSRFPTLIDQHGSWLRGAA